MTKTLKIKNILLKDKKKGSALAFVLVMVFIVAMTLTSLLTYIASQINYSKDRVEREGAFQIAEDGAYYYRWYLAHMVEGKTADQIADFWQNGNPIGVTTPYIADAKDPEGNIVGQYKLEVQPPSAGSTILTVKSTGWTIKKPTALRVIQVRFRRPSWSENVFLSNSFMNFGDQATVYGKVHSNDGIRFDGVAYNTVSSLQSRFDDPTYGGNRMEFGVHTTTNPADGSAPTYPWASGTVPVRSDVFIGGREFPVPEINFAGVTSDLNNMRTQAQNNIGKYFDASGMGRRINIKSNGTYDICTVKTANVNTHAITKYYTNDMTGWCNSCSGACVSNYPIVNNGVIFVENSIWIEGSVNNKKITVVAGGNQADVYVGISNSNLRFAAYDCNNMLGLIAQRDVRVLNDCPDDFTIDAALLAQTGLVGIVNGMGGKYSLTFNGAIASYLQPYFQSGNSGFADRTYNFNNNLLYCPPPYFPTGTEYAIDQWDEL